MSVNNCSVQGDVTYGDSRQESIFVREVPPPEQVMKKWNAQNNGEPKLRIFAAANSNLCQSRQYKESIKGHYKRAKGCYKVYAVDRDGVYRKRFNDYGATLHPEHTRCENTIAANLCDKKGSTGLHPVDPRLRELGRYPFLVEAKRVTVGRGGMFALPCGPFGLFSSCEAVKCGIPEAVKTIGNLSVCRNSKENCPYPIYEKVFVMTQYDDTQIGQFMQEALPKLIYNLEFLYKHPEYKIHYGFTKQPVLPNFVLPHHFFQAFGLLDRLINGTIYAEEIIMPREGGCQDIGYNAWEVVNMRDMFYKMLNIHETKDFLWKHENGSILTIPPKVLLVTRSAGKFTQNKYDLNVRTWSKSELKQLQTGIPVEFPGFTVDLFSDSNATLMTCPLCQAEKFANADIVVGFHGAGLSNAMFMRPGGVLVEVVSKYDSRHIPMIGIFPRISDIIGLHHYSYMKDVGFQIPTFIQDVGAFYRKSKLWAHA